MTDDRVPGNKQLRYLIEGWGKKSRMTSMYFYAWFLAEAERAQSDADQSGESMSRSS